MWPSPPSMAWPRSVRGGPPQNEALK
jgi:hypothetical protein